MTTPHSEMSDLLEIGTHVDRRRRSTACAHRAAVEGSIAHMRAQLAEPLDLEVLSGVAAMSKFHFVRTFEAVTGTTPVHFLSCLRIEQAKRLLSNTKMTVTNVCMSVGYSSLGSFSSAFASLVGMTPSAYRRLAADHLRSTSVLDRCITFLRRQRSMPGLRVKGKIDWIPSKRSDSLVFVGAFARAVPEGPPASGTVLLSPGDFCIARPSLPTFHVLAVQLPFSCLARVVAPSLHAMGVASCFVSGNVDDVLAMQLREPRLTDPPILVELSALI